MKKQMLLVVGLLLSGNAFIKADLSQETVNRILNACTVAGEKNLQDLRGFNVLKEDMEESDVPSKAAGQLTYFLVTQRNRPDLYDALGCDVWLSGKKNSLK